MKAMIVGVLIGAVCLGLLLCVATVVSAGLVDFQWGASTGTVDGYRIYYGDTAGESHDTLLCDVSGTVLSHQADLAEDRPYYLVVRAYNAYGESGDSNEVYYNYELPGVPNILNWTGIQEILSSTGAKSMTLRFVAK